MVFNPLRSVTPDMFFVGLFAALAYTACAQGIQCSSDSNAIQLPKDGLCLQLIQNAKDWVQAQAMCEQKGGSLFRLRNDGQLMPSHLPTLPQCLEGASGKDLTGYDFWIGAVSVWSKHWYWINETLLNPIRYVTTNAHAFQTSQSAFEVCSRYLSVDYCVSVCHDDASAYTILHKQKSYPCCLCSFRLDLKQVNVANSSYFRPDASSYFIAVSGEGKSNMIRLVGSETFSETETMCAVVDTDTSSRRELLTQTCFSERPFLCGLGSNNSVLCDSQNCQSEKCRFRVRDECVQRDSRSVTWFQARFECQAVGGDLWMMDKLDDMYQVSRYLQTGTSYWVGATDHIWSFTAESNIFGIKAPDYEEVRCGHMFLERSGVDAQSRQWKWADTRCDQQKSFICQYEQLPRPSTDVTDSVICPWPLPVSPNPPPSRPPSNATLSPASPTAPAPLPILPTAPSPITDNSTSYSIVPIIAACIAALIILMCAIFMLAFSRHRKWLKNKWIRTRDYLWPFWASSPTFLSPDLSSERGFDSFSTGHTGIHSDSGSIFAANGTLGLHDFSHGENTLQKGLAHARSGDGAKSTESLDRARWLSRSATLNTGVHGGNSASSGSVLHQSFTYGSLPARHVSRQAWVSHASGRNSSMEDRLMSTSYSSLSPRTQEFMTLSAHMNIHDEQDSPDQSAFRRPEVALVTDGVDLNFTVNHAYTRNRHEGNRPGSQHGSERGMDEVDLPSTAIVQIPTRSVEESVMHM